MLRIDAQICQVLDTEDRAIIYVTDVKRDNCIVPIQRIVLVSDDKPNFITFYVHETKNVESNHFYFIPAEFSSREYRCGKDIIDKPDIYSNDKVTGIILIEWIQFVKPNEITESMLNEIEDKFPYPVSLRNELLSDKEYLNGLYGPKSISMTPFMLTTKFKFKAIR